MVTADIACLNTSTADFEAWNSTLPTGPRVPPSGLSRKYVKWVRKLGKDIAQTLDRKMDLKSAHGNVKKTMECIRATLQEHEADTYMADVNARRLGRAAA